MLDIDVKNRQNLARRSQILIPIATVRQAARRSEGSVAGLTLTEQRRNALDSAFRNGILAVSASLSLVHQTALRFCL